MIAMPSPIPINGSSSSSSSSSSSNNNNKNSSGGTSSNAGSAGSLSPTMTASAAARAISGSRTGPSLEPGPGAGAGAGTGAGTCAYIDDGTRKRHWPPRLYLAVDCGGTKTAAAVCDEAGILLGRGHGGPANYTDVGLLAFLNSVQEAVSDALRRVARHLLELPLDAWHSIQTADPPPIRVYDENGGSSSSSPSFSSSSRASIVAALDAIRFPGLPEDARRPWFEAAWFGIAGVDSPVDVTTLSPHLASLLSLPYPSPRLIVANDTSLLASPVTDPSRPEIRSGVVVIAGTGSIVMSFKQRSDGLLKVLGRVGGFGWLLGDEGSGYQVGKSAVRKVLDMADRQRLLAHSDEEDSNDREHGRDGEGCEEHEGSCSTSTSTSEESPDEGELVSFATRSGTIKMRKKPGPRCRVASSRTAARGDSVSKEAPPYGRVLRDRILQHWSIVSTDELLGAVYSDDISAAPSSSGSLRTSPATAKNGGDAETSAAATSSLSASEASANLLPPVAPTLDVEVQFRGASPIPSLSSSPTDSTASSSVHHSSHLAAGPASSARPPNSARSHSESSVRDDRSSRGERQTGERKHRLASLAPLVFHLAFSHDDAMSLDILREQAHHLAKSVAELLKPPPSTRAHLKAHESVLCMGGSLVGVERYRQLLVEELAKLGIAFDSVVYVGDPARSGAVALSAVVEKLRDSET
ncbi:hypothetical protein FA10DRAFT_9150 [Acaromyces ingoldii]|uniref:Uncharacterized protein n=1 Tax=Acaromyces ingoldii TaxID=215250 RepID=A0A316YXT8_9BASI|nr:hypothetical protein FA10DRAFT_9150 [Acaromyces ingoldii]PWN92893.1 hypothetical protein FA10DRAFT_9150 [Acaromyces ingoldii]